MKPTIGVIRGGPSNEYGISLRTGAAVLDAIDRERYEPIDIVIDKSGLWHIRGVQVEPHETVRRINVAFNALHGAYGEDGKIQQLLEAHGVPFTGSGSFASAVTMNKALAKDYFRRGGLNVPAHVVFKKEVLEKELDQGEDAALNAYRAVHTRFAPPYIVKPISGGSSLGVSLVKSHTGFAEALAEAFRHGDTVMIEEFVPGAEASVGIIDGFRGQDFYVLPPVEIQPKDGIFGYEEKYETSSAVSAEIVPATFSPSIKVELGRLAIAAHKALGLRHYSRSDFIIHPRRGIFVIETNSLPGLTESSLLPKALAAVGASLSDFVHHTIELARN